MPDANDVIRLMVISVYDDGCIFPGVSKPVFLRVKDPLRPGRISSPATQLTEANVQVQDVLRLLMVPEVTDDRVFLSNGVRVVAIRA